MTNGNDIDNDIDNTMTDCKPTENRKYTAHERMEKES